MKVQFAPEAQQDLVDIAEYIKAENPLSAARVRDAIMDSIRLLPSFPDLGRQMPGSTARRLVTRRYGYLVYYEIDEAHDEIAILAIYHHARNVDYPNR